MENLIVISGIFFFAGFIQSFTGFGFALVATPLLFFLIDPKTAIVVVICLGSVTIVAMTIVHRQSIDLRRALYLSAGSVLGIPLGAYVLMVLSPESIKLVVGVLIVVLTILLLVNRFPFLRPFGFWHLFIGFCSGLLTSSTSMGGPPMVLFLLSQKVKKAEFYGTISATFNVLNLFTLGTFGTMGMINTDILKTAAAALPALAAGFFLGTRAARKIDNQVFRYITSALVLIAAIIAIITSLASMSLT